MRKIRSFTPQEVAGLLKTARRAARNSLFDLLVAPRALTQARILVITSKRVGSAPERNKIRRQLKAIFHEQQLESGLYDCIVIIKRLDTINSFQQLEELFLRSMTPFMQSNPNHEQ